MARIYSVLTSPNVGKVFKHLDQRLKVCEVYNSASKESDYVLFDIDKKEYINLTSSMFKWNFDEVTPSKEKVAVEEVLKDCGLSLQDLRAISKLDLEGLLKVYGKK